MIKNALKNDFFVDLFEIYAYKLSPKIMYIVLITLTKLSGCVSTYPPAYHLKISVNNELSQKLAMHKQTTFPEYS